jgi:putative MFS transporter
MENKNYKLLFSLPVIVAALGYFVDIYDLLLFSIVRIPSLKSIGIGEAELLDKGEYLMRMQMTGLLVGGIIWGIMGDKKGRLSVLFGSILLYSLANIANGFVTTLNQYALLRFIAGIGLAGELGAGITLVSEVLPTNLRGYGTTIVATVGLMGAVVANFVVKISANWQMSYFIGGGLGLLLLLARVSIFESEMFVKVKGERTDRGNFVKLFTNKERFVKFAGCILIGLPIWYTIGVLVTFSPEFAKVIGVNGAIIPGDSVMYSYIGLAVGDLTSGFSSQFLKSRKKVVLISILLTLIFILLFLFSPFKSVQAFYVTCFLLGVGIGYWALFVTIAAEQFGTDIRSTVATTVPNFIRGTVVPITLGFKFLRGELGSHYGSGNGLIFGALIVGVTTIVIALLALRMIPETFSKDLNYVED